MAITETSMQAEAAAKQTAAEKMSKAAHPSGGVAGVACGNARVRAHYRHLATVIGVRGAIDAVNVDELTDLVLRFVAANEPIVLDLSGVTSFAGNGMWLLCALDGACRETGLEWMLVGGPAVFSVLDNFSHENQFRTAESVPQALRALGDAIVRQRRMVLSLINRPGARKPTIKKTA